MMLDPLRKLATVNNMVQTSVASAERVFAFIDARSEVVEAEDAVDLPPLRDSLRFEHIDFSYNGDAQVLGGLDFEIKKGEMVALVGFSGAGKSTIAKLIPRFYDPTGGRVTIDGVDIRGASLSSLRDQISVVTQDTILFHETIRNNIAFGNAEYSDERVRAAAAAANATGFIEALPEGFDTPLDEDGGNLSGGQRQRLAIARAIIKDPSILILDEATSSLDSESEKAIQSAIEKFVVGRTTLVIAHRLSTIQRADRIVVIDEGRVAEEGPHEALLAKGGIYARLYDVQFGAGQEDAS
jgi:subfamily B ATP-binding cassette protein MsbA